MAQGMGEDKIEARLRELGIVLPVLPKAGGNYLSAKTVGKMVYLAGVISSAAAGVITGTVGLDRTIDEGYIAARACVLTQLAVLQHHLGSLDAVKSIVGINGYVNAVAGFSDSAKVINGASDGGGHGQFKEEDNHRGYEAVWQFLAKLNLGPVK